MFWKETEKLNKGRMIQVRVPMILLYKIQRGDWPVLLPMTYSKAKFDGILALFAFKYSQD